jgi:hypothetical protein
MSAHTRAKKIKTYRHSGDDIRLDVHFFEDGERKAYVVIDKPSIRDALRHPRRKEVPEFGDRLHGLAEHQIAPLAREAIKRIHERIQPRLPPPEDPSVTTENPRRTRKPGKALKVEPHNNTDEVFGVLIYAGPGSHCLFYVDIVEPGGTVRRIEDLALAVALDESGVALYDNIRVARGTKETMRVRERSQGTHGDKAKSFPVHRQSWIVTKETHDDEQADSHRARWQEPGVAVPIFG